MFFFKLFLSNGDFSVSNSKVFWLSPDDHKSKSQDTSLKTTNDNCQLAKNQALIVNVQQTGYYRVNYDETNWKLIHSALVANVSSIHRVNRAQIIDDAMNLARAGSLSYDIASKLIDYLGTHEKEYIPWKSGLRSFQYKKKMLARHVRKLLTECQSTFEKTSDNVEITCNGGALFVNALVIASVCKKWIRDCLRETKDFRVILPHVNLTDLILFLTQLQNPILYDQDSPVIPDPDSLKCAIMNLSPYFNVDSLLEAVEIEDDVSDSMPESNDLTDTEHGMFIGWRNTTYKKLFQQMTSIFLST